ncbi:hypothetical protein SNOUR_42185 [Streptomyces noursei ATCC 11455]|nr:hypothetical protein SNOUR_42185 [Streptomyces noursei ATCC 11455]
MPRHPAPWGAWALPGRGPRRRTIQYELDNRLSKMLPDCSLNPGNTVVADRRDGELKLALETPSAGKDGAGTSGSKEAGTVSGPGS